MNKDVFDKILDELITEAVKDCEIIENEEELNSEVVFSKEHTDKMNKLFEQVRQKERLAQILKISKRVAIIVIVFSVTVALLTPKISAWKERIKEFFIKEEDKYSWIVYGDPAGANGYNTEYHDISPDKSDKSGDKLTDILGYIPEGYEAKILDNSIKSKLIELTNAKKLIRIKVTNSSAKALNTENLDIQSEKINEMDIYFINEDGKYTYTWERDNIVYRVMGKEINKELLIEIIKSINYEKIKNIF